MDDFESQLNRAYLTASDPKAGTELTEAVMVHIARPPSWRYPLLIAAGAVGLAIAAGILGLSGVIQELGEVARWPTNLIQQAQSHWWTAPALALTLLALAAARAVARD